MSFFPSPPELSKLYYRIGEVSDIVDVPSSVLRFWETQFQLEPTRTDSKQRLYRPSEIELFLKIKYLLYTKKFTIHGAKAFLAQRNKPTELTMPAVTDVLNDVKKELLEIKELLS